MQSMKLVVAITTLLLTSTATAMTDTYLQAVQEVREDSYSSAASLFHSQLQTFVDNPVYLNRTRVWFALTLLKEDDHSPEAEAALYKVLCDTLTTQDHVEITKACSSSNFWAPTTQIDDDVISAAVGAYGAIQWRRGEYEIAIQLMNLAIQRALNVRPNDSHAKQALKYLDLKQPATLDEAIGNTVIQQALLKKQLMDQILANKGQLSQENPITLSESQLQSFAESYVANAIAKQQKHLVASNPELTEKVVPGDLQSLNAMREQNMQQLMAAQKRKAACFQQKLAAHKEMLKQGLAKEKVSDQDAGDQLRNITTGWVSECDEAEMANVDSPRLLTSSEKKSVLESERKARRDNQKLARVAAAEPEIFYGLARSTMCQYVDAQKESLPKIEDMQQIFEQSIAASLEASRGQYVQSFEISQRRVLISLNSFLDSKQKLPQRFDPFTHTRDSFLKNLARCSESLNLEGVFGQALLVALTRPSRPHRNEKYLQLLISTARRLRENDLNTNPFASTQEKSEHQLLANFYLRSHQPAKAQLEFQKAFGNYKLAKLFGLTPEIAYMHMKSEAKSLQGMIAASMQSETNTATLEPALNRLRSDVKMLRTEIENRLSLSPDQLLAVQLGDMKPIINETMQSKKMKEALQMMESMFPQSEQDPNSRNPVAQIKQLFNSINKGAMDSKILESAQQLGKSDSMLKQEDVLGSLLERQHQLYNSHARLLLQLVHIELDLNKPDAARGQMNEVESYLRGHAGWIGKRTEAYQQFTDARLLTMENKASAASQAFAEAVKGWYSTPHSTTEMIFSLLESETDILERAGAFAISQGQSSQALHYFELAREVSRKSDHLYGALSEQGLVAEDKSLQQQALNFQEVAGKRAYSQNETELFRSALQKAAVSTQQGQRQQLDPAYGLLTQVEPLKPWLEPRDLGRYVEDVLQQVFRRQALSLNRERIDYLYQQQQLTAPRASFQLPTSQVGNDMTLSERIQQKISDDTLLISIWMGRDRSYITALDKKDVRAHQYPSRPLLKLIGAFNKSYTRTLGHKLYQNLFVPYLDRPYDKIVLVVNGPLQNTAFAALSEDPDKQRWLGDRYLLRTLPYAARLLDSAKPQTDSAEVLVLNGGAVPGRDKLSTGEIDTIFQNFTGKQIAGKQLTRTNLMEQLPRYSIVHFAGHSNINDEFPDFSYLELYNDKAYLLELEQLPLSKVQLVVLGSCASATHVDSSFGNEFSSLQESLLNAGAESVLANLFPVDDKVASKFLSHFYELLAQGNSKGSALQQAQQLIRDKNPNPRDWAGFILSGSEQAL